MEIFFKFAIDPDTIYIRLDDDVVWLEPNLIRKLSKFREQNTEPFLVYSNTINNAMMTYLHQRMNAIDNSSLDIKVEYCAFDPQGLKNPIVAEKVHNNFINKVKNNKLDDYKFKRWNLIGYETVSINCISWLGKDFKEFEGNVHIEEEPWLSRTKPIELNSPNTIFAHFAFGPQREYLDRTDILQKYENLAFNGADG